jgi:hypothetical protein
LRFDDDANPKLRPTWLISPAIDLLFLANLCWPMLFLLQFWGGFEARESVGFWQVYFVTAPHRWITLLIVFGDRELTQRFGRTFLTLFFLIVSLCLMVRFTTGALTCLLTVDYIWNAWHFAAQHHGIYRIYGRLEPAGSSRGETIAKCAMRLLVVYAAIRIAGWSWPFVALDAWLEQADWWLLAIPVGLVAREVTGSLRIHPGRIAYLGSVCLLYSAMILAVHYRRLDLVLILATASALFHATEYLTIVSWRVKNRRNGTRADLLGWLIPRWGLTLLLFAGILGWLSWQLTTQALPLWLLLNVMAAFLHYTYDGLIWKRKRAPVSTS